jgi:SAM-dependent methyltransferase
MIVNTKIKYVHTEDVHNTKTANIVAPIVMEFISEITHKKERLKIVDFGCGIGTWLHVFKKYYNAEILGLDGEWVNKKLLFKYISENEFCEVNMEKYIKLNELYDLVISLEVAEHISESNADIYVQSLVDAGKLILFSAAIPGQSGFNHINCQYPEYWIKKFKKHGYVFFDILRPQIWNDSRIEYWYKQNMFIVASEDIIIENQNKYTFLNNAVIHPELFERVLNRQLGFRFHFKMLLKSIVNKILKTLHK